MPAIGEQTSEIYIDRIAYHLARFSDRLPPGMAPGKRGNKRMVSPFVRFQDDAVRMVHTPIITCNE